MTWKVWGENERKTTVMAREKTECQRVAWLTEEIRLLLTGAYQRKPLHLWPNQFTPKLLLLADSLEESTRKGWIIETAVVWKHVWFWITRPVISGCASPEITMKSIRINTLYCVCARVAHPPAERASETENFPWRNELGLLQITNQSWFSHHDLKPSAESSR